MGADGTTLQLTDGDTSKRGIEVHIVNDGVELAVLIWGYNSDFPEKDPPDFMISLSKDQAIILSNFLEIFEHL